MTTLRTTSCVSNSVSRGNCRVRLFATKTGRSCRKINFVTFCIASVLFSLFQGYKQLLSCQMLFMLEIINSRVSWRKQQGCFMYSLQLKSLLHIYKNKNAYVQSENKKLPSIIDTFSLLEFFFIRSKLHNIQP